MIKKLIIFDCDGVLVNSEKISLEVLRQTIAEDGIQLTFEECRELFMGRSMVSCLKIIEKHLKRSMPKDYFDHFHERIFEEFHRSLEPITGVPQLLQELKEHNISFCVASSGSHEKMDVTLNKCGIADILQGNIYSAYDVERGKPFPDLFLHAAKKMNFAPENCIVIEDSQPGLEAAKSAGMKAVYYCGDHKSVGAAQKADLCCEDMKTLLNQLKINFS